MADVAKDNKQLKIKTGVVKRLWKEHNLYRKEEEDLGVKYDKLVAEGSTDEWKLKNTKNMKDESKKMVFDTQTRLTKAVADLRELVVHAKAHPDLFQDSEEFKEASALLDESNV